MAEDRSHHCYLVVEGLNTTQNEPVPQVFAFKLLIKKKKSENQHSLTKHNIAILKCVTDPSLHQKSNEECG